MLKVKNNNITMTRGETHALTFKLWNTDGTPFILPPVKNKSLIYIARHTVTDTGEEYEFYAPFKAYSTSLTGTNYMSMSLYNRSENAHVDIFKLNANTDEISTERFYIQNNDITVILPVDEMLTSIRYTNCKLDNLMFYSSAGNAGECYTTDMISTLLSAIAFTVRAGNNDDIVLTKYLNACSNTMWDGKTDYTPFGWNKFTSYDIIEADDETTLYERLSNNFKQGYIVLGKIKNNYYHILMHGDGQLSLVPYEFVITIPILSEDTANLEDKEYVYDLIAYQGKINDISIFVENKFPFRMVSWKKELIPVSKYILEATNNA